MGKYGLESATLRIHRDEPEAFTLPGVGASGSLFREPLPAVIRLFNSQRARRSGVGLPRLSRRLLISGAVVGSLQQNRRIRDPLRPALQIAASWRKRQAKPVVSPGHRAAAACYCGRAPGSDG